MNLDDLRKKARGGDLEPEPDKPCDFEGCDNFATYRDEEGHWCHTHRIKMIRETVSMDPTGGSFGGSAATVLYTGSFAATCAVSPSILYTPPSSGSALPPLAPIPPVLSSIEEDKEEPSIVKILRKARLFGKGFVEGLIEDESEGTKK
jgi:hypothetical protein